MELKEGYKQTEVGVIPEDWEVLFLKDVSIKITDGEHATPIRSEYGYYLLSARNILNGSLALDDVDYVGPGEYQRIKQRCNPESGDILISCSGTIGRIATLPIGIECVMVRSAALVKHDRSQVNGLFAQYYLQSVSGQNQIFRSLNQGAQANLFLNHIEKLKIPLPPTKAEQTAIATALSDTDALISRLETLIAKKRAIKQGAMQQLLKPKEGWVVKKLGEIGEFKNGINKASEDFGYGFPFINLMDVFGKSKLVAGLELGLINSNEAEKKVYDLRKGDVVFIRSSVKPEGVGLTCLIEEDLKNTVYSGFIIRFRDFGELSHSFKQYCFYSESFRYST